MVNLNNSNSRFDIFFVNAFSFFLMSPEFELLRLAYENAEYTFF